MEHEKGKAYLLLEDGAVFEGEPLGARGKAIGTVVFNTGMVGYQQLLTTPASQGLLLTQTFPLIGNYGVNQDDSESDRVWAAGCIVREHCELPSNFKSEGTLAGFLLKHGTVGICGLDTRHLTRHIRENGEMKGMVLSEGTFDKDALLEELKNTTERPLDTGGVIGGVGSVVPEPEDSLRLVLIDLGCTRSVRSALLHMVGKYTVRGVDVTAQELRELAPDGVFLSDGPGDPALYSKLADTIREILGYGIPVFGVSLGHQILGMAHGLRPRRMKCGHRGANQPVSSLLTGRTYITLQNHGFTVDETSLNGSVCEVTFENANDHTVEGLAYKDGVSFGVQFLPDCPLPDALPNNHSTAFVYHEFVQMMKDRKGQVNANAAE